MSDKRLPRMGQIVRWDGHPWKVESVGEGCLDLRNLMTGEKLGWTLVQWLDGWQSGEIEQPNGPQPLDRRRPHVGAFIRRGDLVWRVRTVRAGMIHLENPATGETGAVGVTEWLKECWRGESEAVDTPNPAVPKAIRELLEVPLDSLPDNMKAYVEKAAVFISAYQDPAAFYGRWLPDMPADERIVISQRPSRTALQAFLRQVAGATGQKPPGLSTFYSWLEKLRLAGGDIRALAPRYDRRGPQQRQMPALVEGWIVELIGVLWATPRQLPKSKLYDALLSRVDEWNKAHPDQQLWCPTEGHVARYVRETVDRYQAARARKGKKAADRLMKPYGKSVTTSYPFERVEVDHTTLSKLSVLDDRTDEILGRVWVSIALDHYSKMVLALLVHFEGETTPVSFKLLETVMTPKGFLKRLVPNIDYEYPSGVPVSFVFDRTSATNPDRMSWVGLALGVRMDYAEGEDPNAKASLERFIRHMKEDTEKPCGGPKPQTLEEQREQKKAPRPVIKLSVLVRRLWYWATMVYAKEFHLGIKDAPLARCMKAMENRLPRPLRSEVDLTVLLSNREKVHVRRGHVTWQGLMWKGEPLKQIMAHPNYRDDLEVDLLFDKYDVSRAWVVNPFTRVTSKLEPADPTLMEDLMLDQHDRIRKEEGRRKKAYHTKELREAKDRMRKEAEEILGGKGLTPQQRQQVSRFLGKGKRHPMGDDLGDIQPHPDAAPKPDTQTVPEPDVTAGDRRGWVKRRRRRD